MKKKIIISSILFILIFLLCFSYIIFIIERATTRLDNLITLHQVEILREHLLLQVKRVQSDLQARNTRYAKSIDTVIDNVRNMEAIANTCSDCHHSEKMVNQFNDLQKNINSYKNAISRIFTIRANAQRLQIEEDRAYTIGEHLLAMVNNMISIASSKLENRTQAELKNIADTKIVLYILLAIGPLSIAVTAFLVTKGITNPLSKLLFATKTLKKGDLDFKVEGLKDEFGEVADSFNEMSDSLKYSMHTLQESENRYRTLFESAGDAIFMLEAEGDNAGRIVSANKAAADMHGYSVAELLGLNLIKDLDTTDAEDTAPERIRRILNGEWINAELEHRRKDGSVIPVEMSAGLLQYMGNKYILVFNRDISDRKVASNRLNEYLEFLQTLINTIPLPIFYKNENGEYTGCNRAFEEFVGLPKEELLGKTVYETGPAEIADEYHRKDKELIDNPGEQVYEWKVQRKDGETRDVIFYKATFTNAHEEVAGLIGAILDITDRKKMEDSLRRAEQMKLVGEWAAGLAHEIKNSLAGIKISVEVLAEEQDLPEEDRIAVLKAIDEIKRIEFLLKSLLNFAKPPKLDFTPTNMNIILDHTIDFSLKQLSAASEDTPTLTIRRDFDKGLPETMCDSLQMKQVFMNLLLNARDAMPDGGILHVKTFHSKQDNSIYVEISDTGKGINEKIVNKIFTPFFTTKSKGSGLGLAISKRIVDLHDGTIQAENRPGGGGVFRIVLPVRSTSAYQVK